MIISTISKQICPIKHRIRIDKSSAIRVVIPAPQVIEVDLLVIHIPAVTERVQCAQRVRQCPRFAERFAPGVIGILYHLRACAAQQRDHVSLQVIHIGVLAGNGAVVPFHDGRPVLAVIEEVQAVTAQGHMHNILAMQDAFSCSNVVVRIRNGLFCPQAIFVVFKSNRHSRLAHLFELPAVLPGVCPGAVAGRIPDAVILDRDPVIRRQLVFPQGVPEDIGMALNRRTNCSSRICISSLRQDIPAQVIGEHPGRSAGTRRGIRSIVHTDQLPDRVVYVPGSLRPVADAGDIAIVIVGIGQRHAVLRDRLNQARRAVHFAARHIGVGRCVCLPVHRHRPVYM